MPGNVISGKLRPRSAWYVAFDRGTDVSRGFICEGVHFFFLHLDDDHDVVPLNGDFVWCAGLDDDFAVLVAVDDDQ